MGLFKILKICLLGLGMLWFACVPALSVYAEESVWQPVAVVDAATAPTLQSPKSLDLSDLEANSPEIQPKASPIEIQSSDIPFRPEKFVLLQLDEDALKTQLSESVALKSQAIPQVTPQAAPHSKEEPSSNLIELPMPDGSMLSLTVEESSMMERGLSDRYPGIKTYSARSSNRRVWGHLDFSGKGFHGLLMSPKGPIYIDPRTVNGDRYYISYYSKDNRLPDGAEPAACLVESHHSESGLLKSFSDFALGQFQPPQALTIGTNINEYRIAVATTAEYTDYHDDGDNGNGDAVSDALAAVITTINRVNVFFMRDFSAKLNVIANNDDVIFTNPATDNLTNGNTGLLLDEVRPVLNTEIGEENFDVGHVFHVTPRFSSSGVAYLGVFCDPGNIFFESRKSQGVSGSWRPVSDSFDIGLVAHEIGHQIGASHTFNSTTNSCGGTNRSASGAVEPGSGSTIMSYAGICGVNNLQSFEDPMFSTWSIQQMQDQFNSFGGGATCAVQTPSGNMPPSVTSAASFQIPANTPFELSGSGSDPDGGDVLTYSWEQIDAGTASDVNVDTGDNAIFRAFLPVSTPDRVFPKLSALTTNTSSLGEVLPSTNRTITMRLTVRDQNGGVDTSDTILTSTVTSGSGFRVTSFNSNPVVEALTNVNLTWDVAGTTAAPISCSNVDVYFSVDGGISYGAPILSNTPNDGSQLIQVPAVSTNQGRFKVKCNGNVFFDINDADIEVTNGPIIQIQGNSNTIDDGDTSPSQTDHTDFGSVSLQSSTFSRTFTVQNVGTAVLNLTGNPRVSVSGAHSGDFTVTNQPSASINAGNSSDFIIEFDPSATGVRNATVSVLNTDADRSPYTFNIRGAGVAPEIAITGSGLNIADGDTSPRTEDDTDFGSLNIAGESDTHTFQINNSGSETLQLTDNPRVDISGSHAGDFTLFSDAASSVNPGNNTSFSIQFNPSGPGARNATISIDNNDSNENPFNFSITGTGTGVDVSISAVESSDPVAPGESLNYTVTVQNAGPNAAADVVVTTTLDAGLTFSSSSGCAESPGAGAPTCSLGTIPALGMVQFTLNTTVDFATRNSVSTQFNGSTSGFDTQTGNNSQQVATSVELVLPDFSVGIDPALVEENELARLTFTIDNSQSLIAANNMDVSLNLPANLIVADPPSLVNNCGGTFSANASDTSVSLSNGSVAASSLCTISFDLVSDTEDEYLIQSSDLITSSGNSGDVSIVLNVVKNLGGLCFPIRTPSGPLVMICL